MKPQTPNAVVPSVRCAHRSSGGRRCRLSVSYPRSVFCPQHRSERLEEEAADHFLFLSHDCQCFQTAQGINHSLHNLYALLAQNRISPRRAAVLSHICGLLLRTLPQIDADKDAGILDPTASMPINISVSDEDADSGQDSDLGCDSDSETSAGVDTAGQIETQTGTETEAKAATNREAHPDSANPWHPSIPKPEPKKKPS